MASAGLAQPAASRAGFAPRAARVVLLATGLGIAAQLLFYDTGIGLNLPLALGTLLVAGWLVRPTGARRPRARDAWLPVAAVACAAFVALRGDATLQVLDAWAAVALTGAALASFAGLRIVDRSTAGLAMIGARLSWAAVAAGGNTLRSARGALPGRRLLGDLRGMGPVLRGLLIAVPLLVVFVSLFSAADAVFAQLADDLVRWDLDLGDLIGRSLLAVAAAWLAGGLLAFVASGQPTGEATDPGWPERPRLGVTEAVTVLLVLDVLFAAFAMLQAAYLFGGLDTLQASGLTYAEYARRGFFELVAVAVMVGALVLALDGFVARRSRTYVVAIIGLVLLTGVVLGSAYLRLRLYQDAYGWTELRFYVLAAILWLGAGAVGAAIALALDRTRWLPHGLVALSIVFGLGFNLIGPVRFIAEQNIARAIHPHLVAPGGETGLDAWYLAWLGDDALIVLAEGLPDLPPAERREVAALLLDRARFDADLARPTSWQAWNLSRERTRSLLVR